MTDDMANGRGYDYPALGPEEDPDGELALWEGGGYYDEAMGYADPADREKRIECFRAAEQLYLQAADRGNAVACLCLGYVYSYDRCEGRYWGVEDGAPAGREPAGGIVHGKGDAASVGMSGGAPAGFMRQLRAFQNFKVAAEAGIPEACYKLGDMYKNGIGCEAAPELAFHWYSQAAALGRHERPVVLGSIALRLGGCLEEGFGCQPDFQLALEWYGHAVDALEVAVEGGESWYGKALAAARAGVKRCRQELE